MKVPFYGKGEKLVCEIDMTSQPAPDMSFEHSGKYYKVTEVHGDASEGYRCTVRSLSKEEFEGGV